MKYWSSTPSVYCKALLCGIPPQGLEIDEARLEQLLMSDSAYLLNSVGTSLSFTSHNTCLFCLSRITLNTSATIMNGRCNSAHTTASDLYHTCLECASCITAVRRYDPSNCVPCLAFLSAMKTDPDPASVARRTWLKWNRTLVNQWKKNYVALYTPRNVQLLLWADPATLAKYAFHLP